MSENKPTTEAELKSLIDQRCVDAALEAAAAPTSTNRFEIIFNPDGSSDHIILTLGGVVAGHHRDASGTLSTFVQAKVHGAYLVKKNLAADIVAKLERMLSSAEVEAARRRLGGNADG